MTKKPTRRPVTSIGDLWWRLGSQTQVSIIMLLLFGLAYLFGLRIGCVIEDGGKSRFVPHWYVADGWNQPNRREVQVDGLGE